MKPLFSHVFGLKPWEMDQLTHAEFLQFESWANSYVKAMNGG